jgi:hypothetical protein
MNCYKQLKILSLNQIDTIFMGKVSFEFIKCCLQVYRQPVTDFCFAVSKLREHWVETNHAVVGRITLLEQCLADSIRWECQLKEVDAWLSHMEARLNHMFNIGPSESADGFMKEQKVTSKLH